MAGQLLYIRDRLAAPRMARLIEYKQTASIPYSRQGSFPTSRSRSSPDREQACLPCATRNGRPTWRVIPVGPGSRSSRSGLLPSTASAAGTTDGTRPVAAAPGTMVLGRLPGHRDADWHQHPEVGPRRARVADLAFREHLRAPQGHDRGQLHPPPWGHPWQPTCSTAPSRSSRMTSSWRLCPGAWRSPGRPRCQGRRDERGPRRRPARRRGRGSSRSDHRTVPRPIEATRGVNRPDESRVDRGRAHRPPAPGLPPGAARVEVVGVCDLSRAMAESAAERFGVPRWSTDSPAMLEESRPDVVHVTTPPTSHYPLAMAALDAGAHVILEKPATVTFDQLDDLVGHARARGGRWSRIITTSTTARPGRSSS